VALGFVLLAADVQGGGQVAAQACFGTGEAAVHGGERGGEVVGGLWVAEQDQAVAAPAGQVSLVEGEVRQILAGRAMADFPGGFQARAKSLAATVLVVAFALYLAVRLVESIATPLIVLSAISLLTVGVVLIVRMKRSRW